MNNNNDDDVRAAAARFGMLPRERALLCEYEALVYWERECLAARLWARFHDANAQLREAQALMEPRATVVAFFFGDDA